ncbi:MAG: phosphatase PAP2 family protein [Acidobacteria bacterium]|nr:phosphatase PAP2 family protein [Acidobacteriota bacterium]
MATPRSVVERLDDTVDEWFEQLRGNNIADRVFYTASELGDFSLIWHMAGLAKALGPAGPRSAARLSTALALESALVNGAIKSLFRRERPIADPLDRPLKLRQPRTSSFPSGHASSATAAAIILSEGSRYTPVYAALAVVVATSRIHVRIHHTSDVLAGAALGAVLGITARRIGRAIS